MWEDKHPEDKYPAAEHGGKEVPLRILLPVLIAGVMVVLLGLGNSFIVNNILEITVMEVFLG